MIQCLGFGKIIFANRYPFQNGGGVVEYYIKDVPLDDNEPDKNRTFKVKIFYKADETLELLEVGKHVSIDGSLEIDKYKNKDGEWVDKGLYILMQAKNMIQYEPRSKE